MSKFYKLSPVIRVIIVSVLMLILFTGCFAWNFIQIMKNMQNGSINSENVFESEILNDKDRWMKSSSFLKLLLETYQLNEELYQRQTNAQVKTEQQKIQSVLNKFEKFDNKIMHNFLLDSSYKVTSNFKKSRESCLLIIKHLINQKMLSKSYNSKSSIKLVLSHLYLLEAPSMMLIDKMVSSSIQLKLSTALIYLLRNDYFSTSEKTTMYKMLEEFQSKNQTYTGAMRGEMRIMFRVFSDVSINYPWTSSILEQVFGNPIKTYQNLYKKTEAFSKSKGIYTEQSILSMHPFLRIAIPNGQKAKTKLKDHYMNLLILLEELSHSLGLEDRESYNSDCKLKVSFSNKNEASILDVKTGKLYESNSITQDDLIKGLIN